MESPGRSPEHGPEQLATPEGIPPTCMLDDIKAASASGVLEVGGTTTVTEGSSETYAPDRWARFCVGCGACGVSTELRRPVGAWKGVHFPGGPTEMKRVNRQCAAGG